MNKPFARADAEQYAAWFRALADPTRIQIVSALRKQRRPMKVGEIVAAVQVGQSTVSQHLKVLGEVGFVLASRRGTAHYYRLNEACVSGFPTAADLVMGRRPPTAGGRASPGANSRPAPLPRPAGITIRPMRDADAARVLAIYRAGLDTGDASFETRVPSWRDFDAAKLAAHRHVALCERTGGVAGWIAASSVSSRCVYGGVVEHSVFVDPACHRQGVGAALLQALIDSTEAAGIWTIQSGVFPENTASLRLHERAGFRVVGTRERIGCHHGQWRDVVLLERRSADAGRG